MSKQDKVLEYLSEILGETWRIREIYVDKFITPQTQDEIFEDERKRPTAESKAYTLGEWVSYLLTIETNIDKKNVLAAVTALTGLYLKIRDFEARWKIQDDELRLLPHLVNISTYLEEIYSEYETPYFFSVAHPDARVFEEYDIRWRLLSDWRKAEFIVRQNISSVDYGHTFSRIYRTFDLFFQYQKFWPICREPEIKI